MKNIFLPWGPDLQSGYGLLGYNLFAQLCEDAQVAPMMGVEITPALFAAVDTLRQRRMLPAILRSNEYLRADRQRVDGKVQFDATVIHPVDPANFHAFDVWGRSNIARCVFEHTNISQARHDLRSYDRLLCASHWNADLVRDATGRPVDVIHEGVDPSLFFPGPRSEVMNADRFYVFSGGKIEFRKGQDIVLKAFRAFAQNRPEALLVTAWNSPYSHQSQDFRGILEAPLKNGADGKPDILRWALENGVRAEQFLDLGPLPNVFVPMILREMDVALQPSRAEACTSLPIKEAMSCGVPVIIASNTGMLDVVSADNCIALKRQSVVPLHQGMGTRGWGESDIDEIVAALEFAFANRKRAKEIGLAGSRWIAEHGRTWQVHARKIKDYVLQAPA